MNEGAAEMHAERMGSDHWIPEAYPRRGIASNRGGPTLPAGIRKLVAPDFAGSV